MNFVVRLDNFVKKFIFFLIILPPGMVIGKTMAELNCKGAKEKLVFECKIILSEMKTKKKIDQAKFKVGADMPSMPGMHNIKPVMAHSMGNGVYHIKLKLDMYGEWALKMDFTKPRRDRIIKKMIFGKNSHEVLHDHDVVKKHSKKVMKMSHGHDVKHEHN